MTEDAKAAVAALTRFLEAENAAIRRGDLGPVAEQVAQKAALADQVEAAGPALAEALAETPPDPVLIACLDALREQLGTNATLLGQMTQATGSLVAELARLRDRHGLRGIYSVQGVPRGAEPLPVPRFDRSV